MAKTDPHFVDKHRESLIERVYSVMEIADGLLSKRMITDETYSTVSQAATSQKKMRILYRCFTSRAVKDEFYEILKTKCPNLVDDLENGYQDQQGTSSEYYKEPTSEELVHTSSQSYGTAQGHSGDTEEFTPELGEHHYYDWNITYRFQCHYAGKFQCKYTNLVFEMNEKAEVLYGIVSWGRVQLDGVGHMQPAGPLYNIDCSEGSICKLHLPHCQIASDNNQTELAVAHFTDGNLEVIQPLAVTDAHVITDISNLSLFGLLLRIILKDKAIQAQVLLFYKEIYGKTKKSKLHMHLLPRNIPVIEVQNQYEKISISETIYIESSSTCHLVPGKQYRPRCETYTYQPKTEIFELDYAPNYHPTFEVILTADAEEVTLGLLDEHEQEVWESRQVFLPDYTREAFSPQMAKTDPHFVDKHRESLIERVYSVMEIADGLLSKRMITDETYSTVSQAATSQKKMRILYRCFTSRAVKDEFYQILKEKFPNLVDDLENGSHDA